ncbi:MAG TPA: hypothetical protein V6D10_01735 [Trichocoleus sp.]|jgi:hypothetical protein
MTVLLNTVLTLLALVALETVLLVDNAAPLAATCSRPIASGYSCRDV